MTTRPVTGRPGFTLIEIMIVVVIIGMLGSMAASRLKLSLFIEPPATSFQRAVEEATELALSGVSVRFVLKPVTGEDEVVSLYGRGEIVAEAYIKQENDSELSGFLGASGPGTLAWTPIALKHAPTGIGWLMDPQYVYFFTDGSCTPATISYAEGTMGYQNMTVFYLTVTGYCASPPEQQNYAFY